MYLGRVVNFSRSHDAEIENRISRAWAAFGKFSKELYCKHYPLKQRLLLFNATVTATVLYGSGTWVMTKGREQTLRTTMRRMLRKMHGCPRKLQEDSETGEEWIEWIVRATHKVEDVMRSLNIPGWVEEQQTRKHKLAQRVGNTSDNRWTTRLLHWQPLNGQRRVGRPYARWTD